MHIKYPFVIKSLRSCVKTLEPGWKDLLPFHQRSSNEAGYWYRAIRPSSRLTFHFIPKVVDGFEIKAPYRKNNLLYTPSCDGCFL